jgi:septal ring factor EnvC (AmiA/AmiB activator)
MAELRKSAKQTAARQRAREKAADYRQKQDKLEQLATDYFVVADSIDEIEENVETEIAAARERGQQLGADARAKADAVMVAMLELGTPRNEVADRLGIATRDVKRATPVTAAVSRSDAAEL